MSSNKKIYEFSKKNTKKPLFPCISKTLTDLEPILTEFQNEIKEHPSSNKPSKLLKDEKKPNRGSKCLSSFTNFFTKKKNLYLHFSIKNKFFFKITKYAKR